MSAITNEAVEAAYDASLHLNITTSELERILEAAAPFIAAEAWDEGFSDGMDEMATRDNPYRSKP